MNRPEQVTVRMAQVAFASMEGRRPALVVAVGGLILRLDVVDEADARRLDAFAGVVDMVRLATHIDPDR